MAFAFLRKTISTLRGLVESLSGDKARLHAQAEELERLNLLLAPSPRLPTNHRMEESDRRRRFYREYTKFLSVAPLV